MRSIHIAAMAAAAIAIASAAPAATVSTSATGFTLGNNGRTLVTIADLNMPGVATGAAITDGVGGALSISGLTYRPKTGQLYGYSNSTDTMYLIDPDTGVATAQASLAGGTDVETLGVDFNNLVDAARVVTTSDQNIVYFPNNAPQNIAAFTDLAYAVGDANEGADPSVFANAYTNAVPNPTSTLQFGLDSQAGALVNIANNAGTLTTVGDLFFMGEALSLSSDGGLDILSFADGDNTALAVLTTFGAVFSGQGLFLVPLVADAMGRINVELLGALPTSFGGLSGFAVQPVPIPASLGFLLGAMGLLAFFGKRRAV
ncbi:MAG: DUF4394 domain-containing protein [Paracoccaceae bacterium]